ncbi:MAG: hypothetical protein DHS20C11_26570 [Lysobacteraceae bacterium]|nr:MAG: hypothetical protein DHS20C11_26570 [Xanthomonadaceae bacterium]
MDLRSLIEQRLITSFNPVRLEVIDESHLHRGHPGAIGGGGHFRVRISAESLDRLPLIKRHREIYGSLGELMDGPIHALAIEKAP